MTALLLSRRHRCFKAACFVCGWYSKVTAPLQLQPGGNGGTNVRIDRPERIHICLGCIDEARAVATRGRKVRR